MINKHIVIFNVGIADTKNSDLIVENLRNAILQDRYFNFFGGEDMVYTIFVGDVSRRVGDIEIKTFQVPIG
jgi:hypothetical protein